MNATCGSFGTGRAPSSWPCTLLAGLALLAGPGAAHAQANDAWANRTPIASLPFAVTETQMPGATVDPTDPPLPCQGPGSSPSASLWYGYTTGAAPEFLTLRVTNFSIIATIGVYTGTPGSFRIVTGGCASGAGFPNNAFLAGIRLDPGTSYSIVVTNQNNLFSGLTYDLSVATAMRHDVTTTDDTFDGTCDADCSLRDAIAANNVQPGAVLVPSGTYVLTRAGGSEDGNSTGDLDVSNSLGLYGAGRAATIVDGDLADRVVDQLRDDQKATTLILADLTLTRGQPSDDTTPQQLGGAFRSRQLAPGYVAFERVALTASRAGAFGGGLSFSTSGLMRDCLVADNRANSVGGGAALFPPVIRPAEIERTTFARNETMASGGGGLQVQGGVLVTNSTFSGNRAATGGGGINVSAGYLRIASSTIVRNHAGTSLFATDVGGGIRMDSSGFTHQFDHTVIADNTSSGTGDPSPDCTLFDAPIMSQYNHVETATTCPFTGAGDSVGTDPGVDPTLADNGGPTPTHALSPTSVAIDAGAPGGCLDPRGLALATDQRGMSRPIGSACDKGAFELAPDTVFDDGFE